jgi:hypothetical protein
MYITWLIDKTHAPIMPGICIMIASLMTGLGLLLMQQNKAPDAVYVADLQVLTS